jgi:hypothetical protein
VDLGFMLARQWFLPLWLLWMVSALPMMLLLSLLPIPLWAAGALLWWFKPLYEPPLLYWMGRRLFGDRLSWRELRSGWFQAVWPQLLSNLTWRRLHPARSFLMPVTVLERLKGKARSQRIRVLSRKSNAASWLTVIGIHFEVALELSFISLVVMLIPEELHWIDWQDYFFKPDPISEWIQQISGLLAMSLVAPFYVAGGFALYLTRRSELEGWDIELGFRRMLQKQSSSVVGWLGIIGLCGLLAWGGTTTPLEAAEVDTQLASSQEESSPTESEIATPEPFGQGDAWLIQPDREQVQQTVKQVLAHEDFGKEETRTRWDPIPDDDEPEDLDHPILDWLGDLAEGIAAFGELLLWLGGGALLAYLIYWFVTNRDLRPMSFGSSRNGRTVPTQIAGLDLRPESLPDDPAAEAERLIEAGDYRGALSLLYRGALSDLVHRHALEIHDGATEGECRQLVGEQLGQALDGCFSNLTLVWLRQAYAHQSPERDQALALCQEWRGCFGGVDVNL